MDHSAYDNVKDQMGRCGIWCGCCVVGTGVEAELARRHLELITAYGIDHWGPEGADFDAIGRSMTALGTMEPCRGCLRGGGRDDCPIRACATGRGHDDCTECAEAGRCEHNDDVEHMRTGAIRARMLVKTRAGPTGTLIEEWKEEQRLRWPDALLFLG